MKRLILFLPFALLLLILFSFSFLNNKMMTPNDRFEAFVQAWNKLEFAEMENMLNDSRAEGDSTLNGIDRMKKIYQDIQASDVKVTYDTLTEQQLKESKEKGEAVIPFHMEMKTIAGSIRFDYEVSLIYNNEARDWLIDWDAGLIFPELTAGGEIRIRTTAPKRGQILDRNQMPIALNDTVWEIGIVPEEFDENRERTKEKIEDLLHLPRQSIEEALEADWVEPGLFVPLKKIAKTEETLLNELLKISGVQKKAATSRLYPLGEAAAHLVGYLGNITSEELETLNRSVYQAGDKIGKSGLEKLYDEQLRGKTGVKIILEEDGLYSTLAETPVKDGEHIMVTIDATYQEDLFNAYANDKGTAAAINPNTGEVLALVSSPAFDPNQFTFGMTQTAWDALQNDVNNPLFNRFTATYAPGSVLKPVTAAIGLTNGTINLHESLNIKGYVWDKRGYRIRRVTALNQPVDLADALIYSDNIFFAMKAVEMGDDAMVKGLNQFGIGEKLPFQFPVATSTISKTGTLENEALLADTSFGQGEIQVSSLHMALAYTPFFNGGDLIKPVLLSKNETNQIWKGNLLSREHALFMQQILREVVTKGTGTDALNAHTPISGKTGTVELTSERHVNGATNGWFVGYPTNDPDILVAMMVEETNSGTVVEKSTSFLNSVYELEQLRETFDVE